VARLSDEADVAAAVDVMSDSSRSFSYARDRPVVSLSELAIFILLF
jgi:hypothetical protein